MSNQSPNQLPEEKKKLLRTVLSMTGYVFAAVGLATLIFPSAIADMIFDGDIEMGYIFGGALMLVGVSDIVIAFTLFKERKDYD